MGTKLTFNKKITLTFGIIIIISLILYATLITVLFVFNFQNEKFMHNLRKTPGLNESIIKNIEEFNKMPRERRLPPLIILRPDVLYKITFTLSGGVLFIILVATLGGFIFLKRTLKQIDYITKNVEEIDEKKLHLRLNIKGKDAIANMSQTFDAMLNKLETSFDMQKLFFQNASHELNTPLTVIKTSIDVLRQNKNITKEEYEDVLNIINNEIKRLSGISDRLIDLSDSEATKEMIEKDE
jgi:signal transduction histidine kinase